MNIRLTIMLVFVLAIFGVLALVLKPWEQREPPDERPWAWHVDDDQIVHVEVTHKGETVVYDKDLGRGKWFIVDGDERTQVYQDKWAGTPLILSGPKVSRVLLETIENPAQYGLEPPESVIQITEKTGQMYEFWLGGLTPDGEQNYMLLVGNSQLFTVPEIWAMVVNRLVNEPPFTPPALELGYFYEVDVRDIQELEVTHKDVTVTYAPNIEERIWYATVDGEQLPVTAPTWWGLQLNWYAQPGKPGGPDAMGGWLVSEDGAADPQYGLAPPETVVRIKTFDAAHEFYIGGQLIELDDKDEPVLDDEGNKIVQVHYAGLPDDPVVYVVNAGRAERTICLATDPPVGSEYDCAGSGR